MPQCLIPGPVSARLGRSSAVLASVETGKYLVGAVGHGRAHDSFKRRNRFSQVIQHIVGGEAGRMSLREAMLEAAIRSRLVSDKRVGDQPVSLYIVDGNVYLIGRAVTLEQRDIMEFIVRGTPGVKDVNTDEVEVDEVTRQKAGSQ